VQFQLNTDSNIQGDERLAQIAESVATSALGHLTDRLSRIEVHLVDVNGAKVERTGESLNTFFDELKVLAIWISAETGSKNPPP
jgi:hypothetical protein